MKAAEGSYASTKTRPRGSSIAAPANTVAPALDVTNPIVPAVLTVTDGTWTGSPTSFSYDWKRDGASIGAANQNTYTTDAADAGLPISCTVTAGNAGGSTPADSDSTDNVRLALTNTAAPVITSNADISLPLPADILSCSNTGTWTGYETPGGYTYQWRWEDNSVAAGGTTTAQSYEVNALDLGHELHCDVIANNSVGDSAPASSNSSGTVVS